MRIVVNDIAASEGGALSVLQDFYNEIVEKKDDNEWIFLLGDQYLEETKYIKVNCYPEIKKSWFKRLSFDFFSGKKIISHFDPDIYVSLQNTATLGLKIPQIVYLHQTIPYQKEKNFSFFKKREFKLAIYQKVIGKIYDFLFSRSHAKIIVQTKWLKKELDKKLKNQSVVIKPNLNMRMEPRHRKESQITLFFYPASEIIYKNHGVIYQAVDYISQKGYSNFKVVLTIPPRTVNNIDKYEFIGKIDREVVFDYYKKSVLVFPSFIESYGLPLAEAQYFNSFILASDTLFSKEILMDYPNKYFFDWNDYKRLGDLMVSYIENKVELLSTSVNSIRNNQTLLNFIVQSKDNN